MVTTVELSEQEIAELKELTDQASPNDAIRVAMLGYLRYARRMRLKEMSGQLEMTDNWEDLEDAELKSHRGTRESSTD